MPTRLRNAILLIALAVPSLAFAQDIAGKAPQPAPAHFKLVYRLLQVDANDRATDTRSYSTVVATGDHLVISKIRNSDKIREATGSYQDSNNHTLTQFEYRDIGTDIDTNNVEVHSGQLALHVSARSTSIVSPPGGNAASDHPIFRSLTWESDVVVTLLKPTVIFSSQNTSDTGKTELELTATPIKERKMVS